MKRLVFTTRHKNGNEDAHNIQHIGMHRMDTCLDTVKQDGGLSLMVVPICLQQGDLS